MPDVDTDLLAKLAAIVGDAGVITDADAKAPYLEDARKRTRAEALCIVRPRTTREVSEIVKLCARELAPLVPQSGNTGLAYGGLPLSLKGAVVMSLARMNAIRNLQPLAMTMEVEAGVPLRTAKDAAEAANRFLPVTIGSEGTAQIGGVISTNAGGINVVRYGMARNSVLGLEVVLADGTIVNGLRPLRKDNAGYDWKQLFIGTEGTLGVVTAAVMKLSPLPTKSATAFVVLDSVDKALELLSLAQDRIGDSLGAFEMMPRLCYELVEKHFGQKPPTALSNWHVLMEAGSMLNGLEEAIEELLADALERGIATDAVISQNTQQAAQMWLARERMANLGNREGRMVNHDISVPIERMADFVRAADIATEAEFPDVRHLSFGHLGDGNLHYNILLGPEPKTETVNACVHRVVTEFGGSISAEHGIGRYRKHELPLNKSAEELALMRRMKAMLDPDGVLNPGAVV
ncbi:FAD-binding oxidoreductase [Terrarubrum flagellatum]|uniref:FAD-binding oxidoreductase n=1 Tax=Terrirubrum flagellatum TaxID=2895980 RepID=UPI003144F195